MEGRDKVAAGRQIRVRPIDAAEFARFGQVIESHGHAGLPINQGKCLRFHDLAVPDIGANGRAGISLFRAELRSLPYSLDMMERHPFGSQAFIPMDQASMLVTVSEDSDGNPGIPRAFVTGPGQGVNIARNCWHGVLAPLAGSGLHAVIDWIGTECNLVEHWFEQPFTIIA